MKMLLNDHTFFTGLVIFVCLFILVILIYMVAPEAYMEEQCREHYNASTRICNGGYP